MSQITIHHVDQDLSLGGGPEVWVRVLSHEPLAWEDVLKKLTPPQFEQVTRVDSTGRKFFVSEPEDDAVAEGFKMEDWWVLSTVGGKS